MKKRGIFAVWISIMLLTGLFTGCGNKSAKAVEPINNSKGISFINIYRGFSWQNPRKKVYLKGTCVPKGYTVAWQDI